MFSTMQHILVALDSHVTYKILKWWIQSKCHWGFFHRYIPCVCQHTCST